ncbi:MAG: polysaccharide biosynthesis protein CapD [Gemmatimonadetes bacterium]|nr:polysaccharide biosynthesis protein CapD [Gemmatimonadota bacterium]
MRNRHFLILDLLLLAGSPFLAVALRFETFAWPPAVWRAVWIYAALVLVLRVAIAYKSGLYRCIWRHASGAELERILYASAIAGIASFLLGTVGLEVTRLAATRLPYSALALDALFALGIFAGPRLLVRFRAVRGRRSPNARRAIVVGAGAAGQLILRETRLNPKLNVTVVAFVDDDPFKQQHLLGNVPVLGTLGDLPALISRLGVDELIIAIPDARGSVIRKLLQAATDAGITARTVPGLPDLISGRVKVSALRRVEIQDLLRRDAIVTDMEAVKTLATGRTVLITGAGGSIGSELCRQIAAIAPERLVVIDHSENQIFEIDGELRRSFPALNIIPIIADIRDAARIHAIVGEFRPYAIFHAAAHKHVPLMEGNVAEAIANNILGTRNVVDAALDAETMHLVNISTDKAVRPTSIMGATKRVAERVVLHAAVTEKRNFVSVRFGNVLGSRGSVIPTFMRQIQEGGPVLVTHPEMRRYFMTIPEAVQLVLQAGALGQGSELFVLDMGEPIKIVDLARDLIRLSGLEEGGDVEIAYTGVRPGEKLYEEVFFGGEDIRPTNHPKVLRVLDDKHDPSFIDQVDGLIRRAVGHATGDQQLRDALRVLVPEYAREDARTDPRSRPVVASEISAPPRPSLSK